MFGRPGTRPERRLEPGRGAAPRSPTPATSPGPTARLAGGLRAATATRSRASPAPTPTTPPTSGRGSLPATGPTGSRPGSGSCWTWASGVCASWPESTKEDRFTGPFATTTSAPGAGRRQHLRPGDAPPRCARRQPPARRLAAPGDGWLGPRGDRQRTVHRGGVRRLPGRRHAASGRAPSASRAPSCSRAEGRQGRPSALTVVAPRRSVRRLPEDAGATGRVGVGDHMPLFMDVHHMDGGVSAADVAGAHAKDVETQGQYGVDYRHYWVDESQGKIFCLVDAPDAETARQGASRGPRAGGRRDLRGHSGRLTRAPGLRRLESRRPPPPAFQECPWPVSSSTSCPSPRSSTRRARPCTARCRGSGSTGVSDVRQGKRFELEIDGEVTDEVLASVEQMAETLLSNPVIENFTVRVEGDAVRVGVVTFPGSLDDVDAQRAVRIGGHEAVALWHGDHDLRGRRRGRPAGRLLLRRLPALRCDLRFAPVMAEVDRGRRAGACRCSASATASRSSASPTCCPVR